MTDNELKNDGFHSLLFVILILFFSTKYICFSQDVRFLYDLEEMRQQNFKLSLDFNSLNDTKSKISKKLILVEKERN